MNPTSDSSPSPTAAAGRPQVEWLSIWSDVAVAYQTDREGLLTQVSPSVAEILGHTPEQLIGQRFDSIFVTQEPAVPMRAGPSAQLNGDPARLHVSTVRRANGELAFMDIRERVLVDDQGCDVGREGIAYDLTSSMEDIAKDITDDLRVAQERIQEREDHLKRVSRLVTMGELISGIAHEIHQPLHAAQLFAEAARRNLEAESADIETAIDCTREVTAAIVRTASIIRHLRSFTTAKSQVAEMLDINDVLGEVNEILCFEIRKAGVQVEFHKQEGLPEILADRVQLQQIFVHFYRNAIEAMNELPLEGRRMEVHTRLVDGWIEVRVVDRGQGTQEVDLDRLFDAFYSTKPRRLGMGLSICRTIAESYQGQLQAWNNTDGGMTFSLRLPQPKRP